MDGSAGATYSTPTDAQVFAQRRRFAPIEERFWSKVDRSGGPDSCWLWLRTCAPNGYGVTRLWGDQRRYQISAHRAAWTLTHGPIPPGLFVCHHCDNKPCCNPAHLFLGTPKDNLDDMYRKGRQRIPLGEARGMSKLTRAQVLEIRERCARGEIQREVAKLFGVNQPRISKIVNRKQWAWL